MIQVYWLNSPEIHVAFPHRHLASLVCLLDPLRDEGIKDELKEETRVIQDLEQGDEDIEEEDNL